MMTTPDHIIPKNTRSLILLSSAYPFGSAETFLESEIPFLLDAFEHVVILPMFAEGDARETDPRLIVIPPKPLQTIKMFELLRGFFRSDGLFASEWKESPGYPFSPFLAYRIARTAGIGRRVQRQIRQTLNELQLDNPVIYSYWLNQNALGAGLAGKQLGLKTVGRAHGGDLYEERNKGDYLPFQKWKLNHFDAVFTVSEHGKKYLQNRYPGCRAKILLNRLGTKDEGVSEHLPFSDQQSIHLVSCSSVIPLKRVDKIYECVLSLSRLMAKKNFRWTHIGDGPLFSELKELVKTNPCKNLSIDLKGRMGNNAIIPFYKSSKADLIINYSTSEGIPVSIMEAMSCGIPAVAPTVGGIPELVEEPNGMLFDPDTFPDQLAPKIAEWIANSAFNDVSENVRSKWQDEYDRGKNLRSFLNQLGA